jgi:integrase
MLTDAQIKKLKPPPPSQKAPNKYPFANGLRLFHYANDKKIWFIDYRHEEKRVSWRIGTYPDMTQADAFKARENAKKKRDMGIDPKAHHEAQQTQIELVQETNVRTLELLIREWFPIYAATKVKNKRNFSDYTAERQLKDFENHLFPLPVSKMPMDTIETKNIEDALIAIAVNAEDVARRMNGRLIHAFNYAIREKYIKHNPVLVMSADALPARNETHRPALPHDRLPEFFQRLEKDTGRPITKLCTLLTLHIFIRSSEIRFARWDEINWDANEWIIPATREFIDGSPYSARGAKMKEPHHVPLTPQAIEILKQIKPYSGHCKNVFPKLGDDNLFISEGTVNKTLQRMGYDTTVEVCGHGFRTMARSALAESRLFEKDAIEMQMSHQEEDKVVGAYTHMAKYLEERQQMMRWWSDYLDTNREKHITPYHFTLQWQGLTDFTNRNLLLFKAMGQSGLAG